MNSAKRGGCGPVFADFGAGIEIDSEIACGFCRIFCGFHAAERRFDFHIIAFLVDAGTVSDPPGEKSRRGDAENSQQEDDTDRDEKYLSVYCSRFARKQEAGIRLRRRRGVEAGAELGRVEARIGAPHLLQKRVPATMGEPHLLQKAMDYTSWLTCKMGNARV